MQNDKCALLVAPPATCICLDAFNQFTELFIKCFSKHWPSNNLGVLCVENLLSCNKLGQLLLSFLLPYLGLCFLGVYCNPSGYNYECL